MVKTSLVGWRRKGYYWSNTKDGKLRVLAHAQIFVNKRCCQKNVMHENTIKVTSFLFWLLLYFHAYFHAWHFIASKRLLTNICACASTLCVIVFFFVKTCVECFWWPAPSPLFDFAVPTLSRSRKQKRKVSAIRSTWTITMFRFTRFYQCMFCFALRQIVVQIKSLGSRTRKNKESKKLGLFYFVVWFKYTLEKTNVMLKGRKMALSQHPHPFTQPSA